MPHKLTFRVSHGAALSLCRTDKLAIYKQAQRTGMVIEPCLMKKVTVKILSLWRCMSIMRDQRQIDIPQHSLKKTEEPIDSFVGKKETHFNNLHEAEMLNET